MKKWLDRFRFAARTLQQRGLVNGSRFLRRWYYARLNGYPHVLNFEVTSVCNLRCPFCYTQSQQDMSGRGARKLSLETFKRIIDDTKHYCTSVSLHGMGEPLLHEDLPAMIRHAADAGMEVSFSTNAILLTELNARKLIESGLFCMIVSMDGLSDETYLQHRVGAKPGDLERVKANIRRMVALKKEMGRNNPEILMQFIVTKINAHEADAYWGVAKDLGVEAAQLMSLAVDDYVKDPNFGKDVETRYFIPSGSAFSRYQVDETGKRTLVDNPAERVCPQLAGEPVVTSDARIVGCCKDLHTIDDPFGDLDTQSFTDVWNSPAYASFRHDVMMPGKMKKCLSCFPAETPFAEVRTFDSSIDSTALAGESKTDS